MANVDVAKIHTLTGHTDSVYTLQQGREPHLFFSGAGDGLVALWDLTKPNEGQLIARLPHSIYALHYLPALDVLIAGHNYDGIHLLDWKERKELRSLQITSAAIFDIQSFGNDLIIASGDGTVTVVDLEGWVIKKRVTVSQKNVRTLAVNPAAGELAVGCSDHAIRILSMEDWGIKKEINAHENSVFSLVYDPDYKTLLSGSRDARIKAWDVTGGYGLRQEVAAHLYAINHIAYSPDAKHFVTCSLDKSIKVWRSQDLQLLKVIDKSRHAGHGTSVNKLLWTSFNDELVSASDDRTLSVWNIFFRGG